MRKAFASSSPRDMKRSNKALPLQCTSRSFRWTIIVVAMLSAKVDSFVSPTSRIISLPERRLPSTKRKTALNAMDWEQLLYNAESAASNLATTSLQAQSSIITSLPIMYGAGLLTSVSPCVWGLLPITMSYISTAAGERSDKKATVPTVAFAAGLASVFCTLGLIASLVGGVFGASADSGPGGFVVAILSSGVCLTMGLQLLNLVDLPLPSLELGSKSSNSNEEVLIDARGNIMESKEETKESGSLVRTFLLGGSSALVASPCATPVLTSILAYVANTHDPILGTLYLLVYTLGYSTPLLVVAATGGQALANLRDSTGDSIYGRIAPWVTPLTGGVLLWYGTNGLLYAFLGDPSLAGLTILE